MHLFMVTAFFVLFCVHFLCIVRIIAQFSKTLFLHLSWSVDLANESTYLLQYISIYGCAAVAKGCQKA